MMNYKYIFITLFLVTLNLSGGIINTLNDAIGDTNLGKTIGQVGKNTVNIAATVVNLAANVYGSARDYAHGEKNLFEATGITSIYKFGDNVIHGQNVMDTAMDHLLGSDLGDAYMNTMMQATTAAQSIAGMKTGIKIAGYDVGIFPAWGLIHDFAAKPFQDFSDKYTGGMLSIGLDIGLNVVFGGAGELADAFNPLNLDMPPTGSTVGIVKTFQDEEPEQAVQVKERKKAIIEAYHRINYSCHSDKANKKELLTGDSAHVVNAIIKIDIKGSKGTPNKSFTTKPFAFFYGDNITLLVDPKTGVASVYMSGPSTNNQAFLVNCGSKDMPGYTEKICGCAAQGPTIITEKKQCALLPDVETLGMDSLIN